MPTGPRAAAGDAGRVDDGEAAVHVNHVKTRAQLSAGDPTTYDVVRPAAPWFRVAGSLPYIVFPGPIGGFGPHRHGALPRDHVAAFLAPRKG